MELYLLNKLSGLVPLYPSDLDLKKRLVVGETYKAILTVPRNIEFHKKYMALMNMVFQNLPEKYNKKYPTMDSMRKAILIEIGFVDAIVRFNGDVVFVPKSVSFSSMDAMEFAEMFDATLIYILKEILPGISREDIITEIENFM